MRFLLLLLVVLLATSGLYMEAIIALGVWLFLIDLTVTGNLVPVVGQLALAWRNLAVRDQQRQQATAYVPPAAGQG